MKKFLIAICCFFSFVLATAQKFDCKQDSVLKITSEDELRIIDSVKAMLQDKGLLGKRKMEFYIDKMTWAKSKIEYLTARVINLIGVGFKFTDDLLVGFYFNRFRYTHSFDRNRKWSMKTLKNEIPTSVKIFYRYEVLCTIPYDL